MRVQKLYEMDDTVDALYRKYLREVTSPQIDAAKKSAHPRCYISALLILRYLERISDHACYIGDSVYYITTGQLESQTLIILVYHQIYRRT